MAVQMQGQHLTVPASLSFELDVPRLPHLSPVRVEYVEDSIIK